MKLKLELSGIDIVLPEHILLIKTTGREDAGAYTRGNGIIIPDMGSQWPSVDRLADGILHELFHVMTRYKPQIREQLYRVIGFHPCGEVPLPDSLLNRKITNSDAPSSSFFIEVSVKGVPIKVVPIIYSKSEQYNRGELSDYLIFKLMTVEEIRAIDVDWSPVGNEFAIASYGDTRGIWIMNRDGSNARRLTKSNDRSPDWSPDGIQIAFQSLRNGNWDIYVIGTNGQNIRRLTDNTASDMQPTWFRPVRKSVSPKSKLITTWGKLKEFWEMSVNNLNRNYVRGGNTGQPFGRAYNP